MQYLRRQRKEKHKSTGLWIKKTQTISIALLLILLTSMILTTTACQKPKIVWVEAKYKVESIPDDPDHYRISKALYAKLLKIIEDLKAEIKLLKLELKEKD